MAGSPTAAITRKGEDLFLRVKVTPGARQIGLGGGWLDADQNQSLCIKVNQSPDDGKANKAVILLLAKKLGQPKSTISILRGQTSRYKTLCIQQADQACQDQLQALLAKEQA
ncbi:MAG: hypothetical protein COA47_09200 [Robiginitomaculum sp.]|nr:MAG: hypothetical protein COA47_09200 [Robiginitomaculum sp.]